MSTTLIEHPALPQDPKALYFGQNAQLSKDNMAGAKNDNEVLILFLNKAGARSSETLRRYEREVIRFTAWLYQDMAIGYQDVRLKHLQLYLYHVQNLPERWLKAGVLPGQPTRILFKDSIKKGKSTDQIIDVLSSFFTFLEKNRYTYGNPAVSLIRSGEKQARGSTVIRFFHENEWQHVKHCLTTLPCNTPAKQRETARTRYIIQLGYSLGLRESELTNHTCNDIHQDMDGDFYLSILGKGRKRRQLPLNDGVLELIRLHRGQHDLQGISGDLFPLAPRTRSADNPIPQSLSPRGLRFWWQKFMQHCAAEITNELVAERFLEMPFHALRHTALTHLARVMDIEDLAIFAGHDSINTTSQYYHTEAKRLKKMTAEHNL